MNVIETALNENLLKFKVACKSELTDGDIKVLFRNFEITSEKEIGELVNILQQYRPTLYKWFNENI